MKSYVKEKEELVGYELRGALTGKAVGFAKTERSAIELAYKFEQDGLMCSIYKITKILIKTE